MVGTHDLSTASRKVIDEAAMGGRLLLSSITFWEIAFLASHNRLHLGKPTALWIAESLVDPSPVVEPLTKAIAIEAGQLPEGFRSDPADLIILATARITGATLMTRDRRILDYAKAGRLNVMRA